MVNLPSEGKNSNNSLTGVLIFSHISHFQNLKKGFGYTFNLIHYLCLQEKEQIKTQATIG